VADAFGLPERGEKPECTLAEAAELLPAAWAARGRTADSIRGYRSHLAAVLEDWGPRVIADTKPAALLAWIATEQKTGRAARTIRQRLVVLSQAMKAAVDAGWIPSVPCTVPRPRVVATSERTCTPEPQFEKLLKAAPKSKDPRHLALLLLAADAGLRRGEIGRVLGRHVRLGGDGVTNWGTIHIAVLSETSRTRSGKGRTVPVHSQRLHDALKAVSPANDLALLRTTTQGVRLLAEEIWAAAKLGPGSRLHELRHRQLRQRGNDQRAVRQRRDLAVMPEIADGAA
jgi:integrase